MSVPLLIAAALFAAVALFARPASRGAASKPEEKPSKKNPAGEKPTRADELKGYAEAAKGFWDLGREVFSTSKASNSKG